MGKQNSKISKMTVFIWRERHVGYRTVEVEEEDTVYSVKQMISEKLGIEPALLELSYQDEMMDGIKTMALQHQGELHHPTRCHRVRSTTLEVDENPERIC